MQIQACPMNSEQNGEMSWQYLQVLNQHIITARYLEGTLRWSSGLFVCVTEESTLSRSSSDGGQVILMSSEDVSWQLAAMS